MSKHSPAGDSTGRWLREVVAGLPAGPYAWHHFPRRGYRALVEGTEVARVVPVHPRGWCLRVTGYTWNGFQSELAMLGEMAAGMRWFASSRRAMAVAGGLLAASPYGRREMLQAAPPDSEHGEAPAVQASFGF